MKRFAYLALAGLVALAACNNNNTSPKANGTISGTVSVEGTGIAGVNVTLSSGATTTTASGGAYSFTDLKAGAYTVSIDGYPADVVFASTSKAAAISTAGQQVPVDFSGAYIRTSSILGSVSASGVGIAGVSVTATGPDGASSAVTDANGNYHFTGLRDGTYTVEISNIPADYDFTTTSLSVTVGVGESQTAPFVGQAKATQTTATVVIKSVTNATGGAVNPTAVTGQIQVTLSIDPGQNQLSQVCVLLDDSVVANGCQTLGAGVAAQSGAEQANVLEPTFTILTDAVGANGPKYANGDHTLSARVDLTNATQANVTTSMQLTFTNTDEISIDVAADVSGVIGEDGLAWSGGSLTVTGTPVMFSGGEVASMTLCAMQNSATGAPGAGTKVCRSASSSPFTVTLPKSSNSGPDLSDFSSSDVEITAASVTAAGSNGPSVAAGSGPSLRLDNVAPTFAVDLPTSVTNQYLGANFAFASTGSAGPSSSKTVTSLLDPGNTGEVSGNAAVTYHAELATDAGTDNADNNAAVVAGTDAITDVTGLASTITNDAYVLVVDAMDAVGNETIMRMGTPFGVDLVAPTFTVTTGSTPDDAINPQTDNTVNLAIADDYSGFGAMPVEVQVLQRTLSGTGSTVTKCVDAGPDVIIGTADDVITSVPSKGCAYNAQASSTITFHPAATNPAYYYVTWRLSDQAGNLSDSGTRTVLLDMVAPTATVAAFGVASNTVTVSGTVTDNLDIGSWDARLQFGSGITMPFSNPTTVSTFDQPLDGSADASGSAPMIRGYEDGLGGLDYSLTGAGFGAFDVAGNYGEDFFTASQTFGGLGGTVTAATLNNPDICLTGAGSTQCTGPTVPTSVTLKFVATTGPTDTNPFTNGVWFYVESAGGVYAVLGPKQTSPSLQTLTGPDRREWTWTMTLSASQLPPDIIAGGTVNVHAVAVENDLDALQVSNALSVH